MSAPKGQIPHNAGTGQGWTDKRGYRWLYVQENGRRVARREHRVVMEAKIGRKLEPWELVHHKDENTANNHPDNLEIKEWGKHTADHHFGSRRDEDARRSMEAFALMREELRRENRKKPKPVKNDGRYIIDPKRIAGADELYTERFVISNFDKQLMASKYRPRSNRAAAKMCFERVWFHLGSARKFCVGAGLPQLRKAIGELQAKWTDCAVTDTGLSELILDEAMLDKPDEDRLRAILSKHLNGE